MLTLMMDRADTVPLRDGAIVGLRHVVAADADRLVDFFARLSAPPATGDFSAPSHR
jgi:hypothetical protein